jgi:hypothetical protein
VPGRFACLWTFIAFVDTLSANGEWREFAGAQRPAPSAGAQTGLLVRKG